jgi:NAD(P)-dependent dehydrogenase (short-subunit alcohol dehydrogenase family)
MNDSKVILITGASSGIGQACAARLARRGHRVFGTSRRPQGADMLQMDVDDDASVRRAVDLILEKEGRLDVVLNNAGYGMAGAVEQTSVAEAQALFETNVWGVLRVCQAVLPTMREQQSGHIINIGSIAGLIPLPFQGFYCASKFALEGMIEALRMEVRPLGIHVVLVQPGDLCTPFTANRHKVQQARDNPAYTAKYDRALRIMERDEGNGLSAEHVARLVERIVHHPSPRLRYQVASPTQKLAAALKKVLPGALFERIIMQHYEVH